MPECFERTANILYYSFKCESTRLTSDRAIWPFDGVNSFTSYYELLFHQAREETHASEENVDALDKFREKWNANKATLCDWCNAALLVETIPEEITALEVITHRILRILQPFDVMLLQECAETSLKSRVAIEGRDIIMLIGDSGVGKYTLMHFLAGSKLVKRKNYQGSGMDHIEPEVFLPGLEEFTLSPFMKSETHGVHHCQVEFEGRIYHLCDSVGLNDSEGEEQDIANGSTMMKVIRSCKSVKLVIVLTEQVGNRLEQLGNFLTSIQRFVSTISSHLGSIYYLFNRTNLEFFYLFNAKIKSKISNLNKTENTMPGFISLMEDLRDKTLNKARQSTLESAAWVDILNGDRSEIFRALDRMHAIENPSEVFMDHVAESSLKKIKRQCNILKRQVFEAAEAKNFAMLSFRLSQLRSLQECFDFDGIHQAFEEGLRNTFLTIRSILDLAFQRIKRFFKEEMSCNEEDCLECCKLVIELFEMEKLRSQFSLDDHRWLN